MYFRIFWKNKQRSRRIGGSKNEPKTMQSSFAAKAVASLRSVRRPQLEHEQAYRRLHTLQTKDTEFSISFSVCTLGGFKWTTVDLKVQVYLQSFLSNISYFY